MIKLILAYIGMAFGQVGPLAGTGPVVPIRPLIAFPISLGATAGTINGSDHFTLTTTASIVTGDLIIVCTVENIAADVLSMTDGTNTYSAAATQVNFNGINGISQMWYKANAAGVAAPASLQATYSATATALLVAMREPNMAATPIDVAAVASQRSLTVTATTAALTHAPELVSGCGASIATAQLTYSGATGFTNSNGIIASGAGLIANELDWLVSGNLVSESYAPTWTNTAHVASSGASVVGFHQ